MKPLHDDRDQPPLKLRRSAGALAKAEGQEEHEEPYVMVFFVIVVVFVLIVIGPLAVATAAPNLSPCDAARRCRRAAAHRGRSR